ncbi:MAG: hypothetical protein HUJ65_06255, partial [Oscillospiraceae bacterium]|nr:hypothetical protein [Oscillospiraceae bacterium]
MAENERVTYPLSNCQQQVYYQIVYSPNKRLLQIPLYITVNQVLDFDLLRKAIEIEYERNDSLRLRFFRDTDEKQTVRQYFLPEVEPNIKVMDFSGKTKKQQDDGIGADANEVQDWL